MNWAAVRHQPGNCTASTTPWFSGGSGFPVIAEVDGVPRAACTASYTVSLRTAGRYCILQEMFVEPESRSSGVGQAVIEFALEHAVANRCEV